nr:hypothetical protein [Priestia megaterium]
MIKKKGIKGGEMGILKEGVGKVGMGVMDRIIRIGGERMVG